MTTHQGIAQHTISIPSDWPLQRVIDFWIERAIEVGETPTKAAEALGIGRATIYRWIKEHQPQCKTCGEISYGSPTHLQGCPEASP